jgi:uncharacterized protein (TIGR02391 family)
MHSGSGPLLYRDQAPDYHPGYRTTVICHLRGENLATRKPTISAPEPPTLTALQATRLLHRQLERLEEVSKLQYNDPAIDGWVSTTENVLDGAFGKPNGQSHKKTQEFLYASQGPIHMGMSGGEMQRAFKIQTGNRQALLRAYIEQLEDGIPPAIAMGIDQYTFHNTIEAVSGQLLRDGHYKQAALEAYIRVIEEVKARSGSSDLDGDSLMNHSFGCDGRTPLIKFNSLQTDSEKDEQKGLMFLFKGVVGLRNAKAHSNTLFDSPQRAHEYLALASLLMRLLEIATT